MSATSVGTADAPGRRLPLPPPPPGPRTLARAALTPYFWLIVAMLAVGAVLHYFEPIVVRLAPGIPSDLEGYSMDRALFLLPVTYAGFVFGSAGGLTALTVAAAVMVPGCITSDHKLADWSETGAVLLVGALVISWFHAQTAERERRRRALSQLVRTQAELHAHVDALRAEEKVLAALNAVYTLCSQSLDLDQILRDSLNKIMEVMDTDGALVFLIDEETGELQLVAHRGVTRAFIADLGRIRAGEGLNGWVVTNGEPLVVPDVPADPRLCKPVVIQAEIRSAVLVPVRARGRTFGTLCAGSRSPREFRDEEVQLLGACGNALGVALENVRLYQQVRASEGRYRDLFEHANDAIFAHDMEGRIFAANEACSRLTGYAKEELPGLDACVFFSEEDRQKTRLLEERLAAGEIEGEAPRLELSLRRKDGRPVTVELASTIISAESLPRGVQHIARDVTAERRAQESLRSYVRQVTRAQEDERLRISRDLHDETAQSLLLVSQRLDSLAADSRWGLGEEARRYVEDVRFLTLQTLADLRRLSEALRPRILDDLGLVPAVGWIADQLASQEGMEINVEVRGRERELSRDRQVLFFRIAQEALSNVRRHSGATHVDVVLEFGDEALTLTVADDGQGFAPATSMDDLAATGRLGMVGMQERTRLLGGELSVRSQPGGGTSVSVVAPL